MFSTRTIINILDDPAETVSSVKYLNRSGLVAQASVKCAKTLGQAVKKAACRVKTEAFIVC